MKFLKEAVVYSSATYGDYYLGDDFYELEEKYKSFTAVGSHWIFGYSVECDLFVVDNNLIVAFQGSWSVGDWISNLKIKMKHQNFLMPKVFWGVPKILVHSGFIKQYSLISEALKDEIDTILFEKEIENVIFTGHSLGGALASLAVSDCLETIQEQEIGGDIYYYSFGAPKIGNKYFSKLFNTIFKNSYRVVYKNDSIVNILPDFIGYRHIANKVIQIGERGFPWFNPFDHSPKKYLASILSDDCENFLYKS